MQKYFFLMLSVVALFFFSCKKNDTNPNNVTDKKILVGTAKSSDNYTVNLYSNTDNLRIGYYPLNVEVKDNNGANVTNASVQLSLLMQMLTMSHASPVEQPKNYDSKENLYKGGSAFFTMASNEKEGWTVKVKVSINNVVREFAVPVWVEPSKKISASIATKHIAKFTGSDNKTYFLALIKPGINDYKVGIQNLEVAVFYMENMMSFPPVNNLQLSYVPTMPSMNSHSSPNNENPVFTSNGHYAGKVNFTMTGDWRLTFTIKKDADIIGKDIALDIYF